CANISTSFTEFTKLMFTESIEPTKPTFTESTEPIFTKFTEPTFTKSTESTKLIESIESTESNGMLVKFTELTTSFISVEYTESIASVDSTDFTSAPIESIEYAEASKSTKFKTTKSKAIFKKTQIIQLLKELNMPIIHTESDATKANQMVIRSWYEFADEFDKQINQTLRNQKKSKHRSSKKSATSE
ncbi:24111_t:CDS:2, partial [Cetraspora pellucida]